MELPAGTVALGRALMHLSRRTATGVLKIETSSGICHVTVVDGRPCGSEGLCAPGDSLGEQLAQEGLLDSLAHAKALATSRPHGLVGTWLTDNRLASRAAVAHGLRRQLRSRLSALLERERVDYRFFEGARGVCQLAVEEAPHASHVVLESLRRASQSLDSTASAALLQSDSLSLTEPGREVLGQGPLWPEEVALRRMLTSGVATSRLRAFVKSYPRALRLLLALERFGGVRATAAHGQDCTSLLHKHRQLRRHADPYTLLDLPQGASAAQARTALRRLARQLHPDRLGAAHQDLHAISNDVLRGLLHAEESIRIGRATT